MNSVNKKIIFKVNSQKVLNLVNFKIHKCIIKIKHNKYNCFYYHDKNDKRRNLLRYNYYGIKCNANCYKNSCKFSHNYNEEFYHPNNYKKQLCKNFFIKKLCNFKFCNFAHSEDELNIKIIHKTYEKNNNFFIFHFKTEFCPFSFFEHNTFFCLYAHNFQDFKRNFIFNLYPKSCSMWEINLKNKIYEKNCFNGFLCKFCHGWKEISYHPFIYKSKRCKNYKNCKYGDFCPYWHLEKEKRNLQIENNKEFIYVPKKFN